MPRLVSDDVPTSGRPVLHPANGHRDNLHASKKKRKAKAGSNRFGNRRLSRSEQSGRLRSEEHTSELQSLMRISYAVFCLKKKTTYTNTHQLQTIKKDNKRTYNSE